MRLELRVTYLAAKKDDGDSTAWARTQLIIIEEKFKHDEANVDARISQLKEKRKQLEWENSVKVEKSDLEQQ